MPAPEFAITSMKKDLLDAAYSPGNRTLNLHSFNLNTSKGTS